MSSIHRTSSGSFPQLEGRISSQSPGYSGLWDDLLELSEGDPTQTSRGHKGSFWAFGGLLGTIRSY